MGDFPDLVSAVERRARRIRGSKAGGFVLLALGNIYFAVSIAIRSAGGTIPIPLAVAGVLIALLVSAASSIVVYLRRIEPAGLLLRLDFALGLPARLSSLHELGEGGSAAIRRRIEAKAALHLKRWREGLPIPRRAVVGSVLGISLLLAGLGLSLLPGGTGPFSANPIQPGSNPAPPPAGATAPAGKELGGAPPLPDEGDTRGSSGLQTGYSLAGVIDELRIPLSLVQGSTGSVEAEARVRDLLARIEGRLSAEGGLLTEAERAELEWAIPTASPPVAAAISDLLAAASPAELAARLEELAEAVEAATLVSGGPEGTAALPQAGGVTEVGGESVGMPETEAASVTPSSSPAISEGEGPFPGSENGGEVPAEGSAPAGEEGPQRFLLAPVPGTIGEEGKIDLLLTAGVPIEEGAGSGNGGSISVSFERIDSILSERSLPPSAVEAVRRYFEAITEGGS